MLLISASPTRKKRTTAEFIEDSQIVHNNKYDYSKTVFTSVHDKVIITCPVHGEFEQKAKHHLNGHGCRKCFDDKSRARTTVEFIEQARAIHGDKYDYSKTEYTRCDSKVTITCAIHGDFEQKAKDHLQGCDCAKCANGANSSKIANRWLDSLNIAHEHRELTSKEFPRRPVDAYIAETNTVYQFHGDYWHGNTSKYDVSKIHRQTGKTMGELYEATLAWEEQIRNLGYNLVVMWESDYLKNSLISNL